MSARHASSSAGRPRVPVRTVVVLAVAAAVLVASAPTVAADPAAEEFRRDIERLDEQQVLVRREAERLAAEQQAVRQRQRQLDGELQEATDRLAELEAELGTLIDAAVQTAREVATLIDAGARQRERLGGRARALYRQGAVDPMLRMLNGSSTAEIVDNAHFVAALSNKDATAAEGYEASRTRLDRRQADLADAREQVAAARAEVEAARAELQVKLEEAAALEQQLVDLSEEAEANLAQLEREEAQRRRQEQQRLEEIERRRREEAARRRAAEAAARARREAERRAADAASRARGGSSGGGGRGRSAASVCPQGQPRSFSNDWGFPRSGGRRHKGTDIFGRMGGPVYAITDGTVQFTRVTGRSGLWLSLRGDDGNSYWYMHLASFGARRGQRVTAGQRIGTNGDTGNAKGTPPHIHFEYHPGGGGPVNPYALLRSVCG